MSFGKIEYEVERISARTFRPRAAKLVLVEHDHDGCRWPSMHALPRRPDNRLARNLHSDKETAPPLAFPQ
jgi:hypothetical protein